MLIYYFLVNVLGLSLEYSFEKKFNLVYTSYMNTFKISRSKKINKVYPLCSPQQTIQVRHWAY